jgi:hypothetical protein
MTIVFLLEEESMRETLKVLLPKLLPDEILTHAMFCQWWWATKRRCPPYLA